MAARSSRPPGAVRFLSLLSLVAFVATGPGTAGVEVAYHLAGGGTEDHARTSHLEQAGGAAHADHCQLGLTTAEGRLPTSGPDRLVPAVVPVRSGCQPVVAAPSPPPFRLPNSRAPPAV